MKSLLAKELNESHWVNLNNCLRGNSHNIELWEADRNNFSISNMVNLIRGFLGGVGGEEVVSSNAANRPNWKEFGNYCI